MRAFMLVGLGGWAGAVCRYGLDRLITLRLGHAFPYGTLAVNLLGCFIIGVMGTWTLQRTSWISEDLRFLVGIGFIGAFTTFSTYILEAVHLHETGRTPVALLYLVGSVMGGWLAVVLGIALARALVR